MKYDLNCFSSMIYYGTILSEEGVDCSFYVWGLTAALTLVRVGCF